MSWQKLIAIRDDGTIVEIHPRELTVGIREGHTPLKLSEGGQMKSPTANPITISFVGDVGDKSWAIVR